MNYSYLFFFYCMHEKLTLSVGFPLSRKTNVRKPTLHTTIFFSFIRNASYFEKEIHD